MDRNTARFATFVALFVVSAASPRRAKAAEPCDDPYLAIVLDTRPATILHRPAVAPRVHRTRFQLGASLGYTAMTGFTRLSAPTIEAVAALRFGGGVSEHLGLRLSAFAAAPIKSSSDNSYGASSEDDARAYGASLALQISWNNGFWLAPGLGVLRYRGPLAFMMCDASAFGEGGGCGSDELTVPELTLGIGWEISLSRNVALQLAGQAGTAIVTLRGSLYAGLSILL